MIACQQSLRAFYRNLLTGSREILVTSDNVTTRVLTTTHLFNVPGLLPSAQSNQIFDRTFCLPSCIHLIQIELFAASLLILMIALMENSPEICS